jgi:Reverse transcriptase (RNA-dependent DNA polymerase)
MAYPQADISTNHVYIEIHKGFEFEGGWDTHCLHVLKNIYGGKDAGRTWNQYLVKGLRELGFEQASAEECVFYWDTTTFMVYVDDGILIDPDNKKIEAALKDLKSKFEVQDEGDLSDYWVWKCRSIQMGPSGSRSCIWLIQFWKIYGWSTMGAVSKTADTPCGHDGKMHKDEGGMEFDYSWEYCSVIGKMNYFYKRPSCFQCPSVHLLHVSTNESPQRKRWNESVDIRAVLHK